MGRSIAPRMFRRHLTTFVIGAIALAAGIAVWRLRGGEAVERAMGLSLSLAATILPSVLAGLLLSAALRQLVPPGALARWMGSESGLRGLLVASLAGMAMPGGPVAAFPVVIVLAGAGADRGALIAFVTAWSLNGFQRIVVWEWPILGTEFAVLRFICGAPLPVLAGLAARWLPIPWTTADAPAMRRDEGGR